MTSSAQPRRGRAATARVLTALAAGWLLISLALASLLMWEFISEFNSCADLARLDITSPIFIGLVASVPGFIGLLLAGRLRAPQSTRNFFRFAKGAGVACVVLFVTGAVAPKPGPPCIVRRAGLPSKLNELAALQEVFKSDSQRYSASLEAIGASRRQFNEYNIHTTIVWADSASWGAYIVFADSSSPRSVTRWVCGIFYPDDRAVSRTVEGIGPLRNGCWAAK